MHEAAQHITNAALALQYAQRGWYVFPVTGKVPLRGSAGLNDATLDPTQIETWWSANPERGIAVNCGLSGLVAIDCDGNTGRAAWRTLCEGRTTPTLVAVTANNGRHWLYRKPPGARVQSRNRQWESVDIKADGGYIVLPSAVEPGRRWIDPQAEVALLPEWVTEALEGTTVPRKAQEAPRSRSMLSGLLLTPPGRGDGKTNEWAIRVFGHYAVRYRQERDLYEIHCTQAMNLVDPDYPDYIKCRESAWDTEQNKTTADLTREVAPANGWLLGAESQLWARVNVGNKDAPEWKMEQWADFDISAHGVTDADGGLTRSYDVTLHRLLEGDIRVDLPASKLGDQRALNIWLANLGVSIIPPANETRSLGSTSNRLLRYLQNQNPPRYRSVAHLGWHDHTFITHDGVISKTGLHEFTTHKPDPRLREWAPFKYGFEGTQQQAIDVLREVLTFHDEQYTAVFAAWWAACWFKPYLPGQYPYMLIEAPSGHGKTTGFNPLMLQLAGNTLGQMFGTTASIRDHLAGHNAGPVWVDDLSDTTRLEELLRQMTNDGTAVKKAEDNTGQIASSLVSPLVLSGEGFPNLRTQKAQLDRAVLLAPPSPVGRKSLHDPLQPQWADIERLHTAYPHGLTTIAGHIAQAFITEGERMLSTVGVVEPGGRFKEKMRILRFGADLLARVTGQQMWVQRVDDWCNEQMPTTENVLTLKVIPAALLSLNWPEKVAGNYGATNAVYIDAGRVYVNIPSLADWWSQKHYHRIDMRVESSDALLAQVKQVAETTVRRRSSSSGTANLRYWRLTAEASAAVLERSHGGEERQQKQEQPMAAEQTVLEGTREMDYWITPEAL